LQQARKKLDVARSEVLTTGAHEDSSFLGCDEMATGKQLRADVLRSLLPPYSRTESTRQHIAVDLGFKKLSRDESNDVYVVWITHHKFKYVTNPTLRRIQ
jgi:hypothetical protein